jgi:hypothetical protein
LSRRNDRDDRSKQRRPGTGAAVLAGALLVSGCLPTQYSECADPVALATVRQALLRPMDVAKVRADGEHGSSRAFGAYSALVSSSETSFSSIRTAAHDGEAGRSNCVAIMEVPLPHAVRTALTASESQVLLARAGMANGLTSIPMEIGYVVQTIGIPSRLHVEIVNGEDVLRRLFFIVAAQAAFEGANGGPHGHAGPPAAAEVRWVL